MENSEQIFTTALGLEEPWHIEKVVLNKDKSQLDIYLHFTRGFKFKMNDQQDYVAHDTVDRTWQHLDFFNTNVIYMHKLHRK